MFCYSFLIPTRHSELDSESLVFYILLFFLSPCPALMRDQGMNFRMLNQVQHDREYSVAFLSALEDSLLQGLIPISN